MLRIEKVFLQGFKSFCDPTEVIFDLEGITAVVGPNGCGKSNVADALNWVIGEQRAKALRGGKMEDVIFQGSKNRQPAGMAEVVLTMRVFESFEVRTQENVKEEFKVDFPRIENPLVLNNDEESQLAPTLEEAQIKKQKKKTIPKTTTKLYGEGDRIVIARRLYRSGESEYEMNGRSCRLRDIQDVFAGTGLGAAHYAIIEQGRIGQVLSAKPLDRRGLIEEAAGVSKFKLRQKAAELKLEAAKQNLARITDILSEVERQQNSLKRQAAKARRFQRLKDEQRGLMRWVYFSDYQRSKQRLSDIEQNQEGFSTQETIGAEAIALHEATRLQINANISAQEQKLQQERENANQANLNIEKLRQQLEFTQRQITSITQRIENASRDQIAITSRGQFTEQESLRLRDELLRIEDEINAEAKQLSEAEAGHQERMKVEREAEIALTSAQTALREAATFRERWSQLVRQFSEATDRASRQFEGLTNEKTRATQQLETLSMERENLALRLEELQLRYENSTIEIQDLDHQLANVKQQQQTALQRDASLRNDLTACQQRLQSLQELDASRSYFSEAVQALTRHVREQKEAASFSLLGTLADFIKVDAEQERMIEIGLREEMQYVVVRTFQDALEAIKFLKAGAHGRATFLVLDNGNQASSVPASAHESNIIRLLDLLNLAPDIKAVLYHALPRLAGTQILTEVEQAIASSIQSNGKGSSFLTPTGELVSAGHLITGGSTSQQNQSALALKREIGNLQIKAEELEEEVLELRLQIESLQEDINTLTSSKQNLDANLRTLDKDIALTRGQSQQIERELSRAQTHVNIVAKDISRAESELSEFQNKLIHAQSELDTAQKQFIQLEAESNEIQLRVNNDRAAATERNQELSRRRADFAAKSERRKGLQNDLRRLENEARDITERLSVAQLDTIENQEKITALQSEMSEFESTVQEAEGELAIFRAQVQGSEVELATLKEQLVLTETALERERNQLMQAREARNAIEIERARLLAQIEHVSQSCLADLNETIEMLANRFTSTSEESVEDLSQSNQLENQIKLESAISADESENDQDSQEPSVFGTNYDQIPDNFDLDTAKIRLNELRQKLDALGPVNLLALQELSELDERGVFLVEQKADIEAAIADTQMAINEIKHRSRERFLDAFNQINKNFSEMFVELFGGGHGEMRLIDESDVLESGIDIIAQPPGKRLQNVLLLSGGEKAMAALSLVMGIFKYRPSPFCLLDEVDAPLDEMNIGRFSDKILEMSKNTQFMVITHSKRTMEAARTLYGVTMQDPGISKLVSVRLT